MIGLIKSSRAFTELGLGGEVIDKKPIINVQGLPDRSLARSIFTFESSLILLIVPNL